MRSAAVGDATTGSSFAPVRQMLQKTRRTPSRRSKSPMTDISLLFEPPFARIVLNRPERRNAISRAMWRALPAIRAAIEARQDALVVLVEGRGGHFSAGADISEFDEVYRDAAAARDYGDAVQDGLNALIDLDRPSIAVLQGNAVGGGIGLALACDLRFCAADAYLAVTPAKLGLVYGHAGDPASRRAGRTFAGEGPSVHRSADRDRGGACDRADRPSGRDRAARHGARLCARPGRAQPGVDPGRQAHGRRDRRRHDCRNPGFPRARRIRRARRRLCGGARCVRREANGEVLLSRRDSPASARLMTGVRRRTP